MLSFSPFNRMIYLGILCSVYILNGCAPKQISGKMTMPYLNIKQQGLRAGLILPDPEKMNDKHYNDHCIGSFNLSYSEEVRKIAVEACSQIFESVAIIDNIQNNVGRYDIFIQLSDPKLKFEGHCPWLGGPIVGGPDPIGLTVTAVSSAIVLLSSVHP
jgi:hypothetical protein